MSIIQWIMKYPTIIKDSSNKFDGILTIKGTLYRIYMHVPDFPKTTMMKITVSGCRILKIDPANYENIFDFMIDLEKELNSKKSQSRPCTINKNLLDQLFHLKEKHKFEISEDFTQIKLVNIPDFDQHYLEIAITENGSFKVKDHSLPESVDLNAASGKLEYLVNDFLKYLGHMEELYANLNAIDELCFVIAPPTTKSNFRIVKFSDKVFLKIILDPFAPTTVQLEFIGPQEEVSILRQKYNEKIGEWDPDSDVYANILRMFALTFLPYHPASDPNAKEQKECSICFEFNLDNSYPIITCYNPKCVCVFHLICLKKWFATLDDTKTFYTIATGACPYCKQKLQTF